MTVLDQSESRIFKRFMVREPYLRTFIRRFFRGKAIVDDICQETIVRALEAERSREIDSPDAFLFGVARNVVRKQLEKQSNSIIDFIEDIAPGEFEAGTPTIEQAIDGQQEMEHFTQSVAKLPRQCQRVFVLKKVYGYSHKEISAKLGISISTIEKQVSTGMKRCLDEMERTGHDLAIVTRKREKNE